MSRKYNNNTTLYTLMNKKRARAILVEGPDCSGKSTLINTLKNVLRWDSKSLHHREGDQFERYLLEYSLADRVVLDRGHISEEVYGRMWRGGDPFDLIERRILDEIVGKKMLMIFACPPTNLMKERYLSREYKQQIKLNELVLAKRLFCYRIKRMPYFYYASINMNELNEVIRTVLGDLKI